MYFWQTKTVEKHVLRVHKNTSKISEWFRLWLSSIKVFQLLLSPEYCIQWCSLGMFSGTYWNEGTITCEKHLFYNFRYRILGWNFWRYWITLHCKILWFIQWSSVHIYLSIPCTSFFFPSHPFWNNICSISFVFHKWPRLKLSSNCKSEADTSKVEHKVVIIGDFLVLLRTFFILHAFIVLLQGQTSKSLLFSVRWWFHCYQPQAKFGRCWEQFKVSVGTLFYLLSRLSATKIGIQPNIGT